MFVPLKFAFGLSIVEEPYSKATWILSPIGAKEKFVPDTQISLRGQTGSDGIPLAIPSSVPNHFHFFIHRNTIITVLILERAQKDVLTNLSEYQSTYQLLRQSHNWV